MKTMVTVNLSWTDGTRAETVVLPYLVEGDVDAGEAEEALRGALDDFFSRGGESFIREAWEESSGDFNWGDHLVQGYGTDYHAANGITAVGPRDAVTFERHVVVSLNHDETLFPQEWRDRMLDEDLEEESGAASGTREDGRSDLGD